MEENRKIEKDCGGCVMNRMDKAGVKKNESQKTKNERRGRKSSIRKSLEVGLFKVLVVSGEDYMNISSVMMEEDRERKVELINNGGGDWPKTTTSQP